MVFLRGKLILKGKYKERYMVMIPKLGKEKNWIKLLILFVSLVVLVCVPVFGTRRAMAVGTMVFIYISLGQSWNTLSGLSGLFSITHAVFYGLGAYSTIAGIRHGFPVAGAILTGLGLNLIFGFIVGGISAKLSGIFFTMSMIALAQALNSLAVLLYYITGGINSIALSREYVLPRPVTYWMAFGMAVCMTCVFHFIRKSKLGTHFVTIRENPNLARALGCNVPMWRILAILISSVMASLAGTMYAFYSLSVSNTILSGTISLKIIIVVMVGGLGTTLGPWFGSIIIILDELIRGAMPTRFAPFSVITYAVVLILVALFKSDGIISFLGIRDQSPHFGERLQDALDGTE
jgi:branched-chain amino acid transport system permease protein